MGYRSKNSKRKIILEETGTRTYTSRLKGNFTTGEVCDTLLAVFCTYAKETINKHGVPKEVIKYAAIKAIDEIEVGE